MPAVKPQSPEEFSELVAERKRRRAEGLSLYRPRIEQVPFHTSTASECGVGGGNRSGKTVCCAAEVAGAALRKRIIGPDGEPLCYKYPRRPLVIWLIGFDQRHIARMGRKLFHAGLFRCVKDPETGELRMWKGYDEESELEKETVLSPPLIPARAIKGHKPGKSWKEASGVAWENKAMGVFNSVELANGTTIYAFPSSTEAAIGDAVDLIWVDEDVTNPGIIPELQARTADVRGRMIWSSWPRMSNDALQELHKSAMKVADELDPDPFWMNLTFSGNPFIPPKEREKKVRRWKEQGYAVWRARDLGEFQSDRVLVFPNFHHAVHCLPREDDRPPSDLERFLAENDWEVPGSWTWYLGIDPGHTRCGCVPLVIPPPSLGDFAIVPGEVFLEVAEPNDAAAVLADRWPHVRWEAFVIDFRESRKSAGGTSTKTIEFWEEAFKKHCLRCRQTDHHITYGLDDHSARNMTIREWLNAREEGPSKLLLLRDETPQLQKEFGLFKKKVTKDDVKEDIIRKNNDCIDALGYVVTFDPVWVPEGEDDTWRPSQIADQMIHELEKQFSNSPPDQGFSMGPGVAGSTYATPV